MAAARRPGKTDMPRLFTYVIPNDGGFAPNPFIGVCTLNCCKPVIRRTTQKGDWVAATQRPTSLPGLVCSSTPCGLRIR